MKVIVTGMHRSGTSMVAGLLNICGLYLGKNLLGKSPSNIKGHFEDRNFLQLNIEILQSNGGSWDRPPAQIEMPGRYFYLKMKNFVSKWPKTKIIGWKDPRACLTLNLWREVLNPAELRIVCVLRPFDEIIQSLRSRNNIDERAGQALCLEYSKRLTKNIEGLESIATNYPKYFNDWLQELEKVTDFLELRIPGNSFHITKFIDPQLYHYKGE